MMNFIKKNWQLLALITLALVVFAVSVRMNIFRYNNFELGKFDLGNMSQMAWNTLHGRFMWLTDYFGTNAPRWAMSHVDPILVLFIPLFAIFQHPLTLVFQQLFLVIFSAILLFYIANLELESKTAAMFIAMSYLLYPALGFLNAWTGYHGVTAAMPFFFAAWLTYELMHKKGKFTKKGMGLFWLFLILVMAGKEQLPVYIALYGVFIAFFRNNVKLGIKMFAVGVTWFVLAFFVIIPYYSHYRIEGFQKFAQSLNLDTSVTRDVENSNYFLSRYEDFGESYGEIAINMLTNPSTLVKVAFEGDKLENFTQTLAPLGYLPFAYPQIFMISGIDFAINYFTTAGGIGTAEIYNHRISMIIPVLFISVVYAIGYLGRSGAFWVNKKFPKVKPVYFFIGLAFFVLLTNVKTTSDYQNPIFLWLTQAVQKRVPMLAHAKEEAAILEEAPVVGKSYEIADLENKDRECALKITNIIPENASVTGPDFLGAHLSMRETYGIFPALYKDADYVIVDVFSRKILTILDIDLDLVQDVVGYLIQTNDYKLYTGCGNLFVFKKEHTEKNPLLPIQERFEYEEKVNYEILRGLNIVDYELPEQMERQQSSTLKIVFSRKEDGTLKGYFKFLTFINTKNGESYQIATLPSFGLLQLDDWQESNYYIEYDEIVLPNFIDSGTYYVFNGISNVLESSSVYLGEVEVL